MKSEQEFSVVAVLSRRIFHKNGGIFASLRRAKLISSLDSRQETRGIFDSSQET